MGILAIQICKKFNLVTEVAQCSHDTVIYFMSFSEDRLPIKFLVFGLATIEIFQSILVSRDIYAALVATPDINRTALNSIQNHWVNLPVVGGVCK